MKRALEGSQFVTSDAEGHVRMVSHIDEVVGEFPLEPIIRLLGEPTYNPGVPSGALTFVTRVRVVVGRWVYFADVVPGSNSYRTQFLHGLYSYNSYL